MRQSVEEKIKLAFSIWDEQATDIGFNKKNVWKGIGVESKNYYKRSLFYRVARVAIILFLCGGWMYSNYVKNQLEISYDRLVQEMSFSRDSLERLVVQAENKLTPSNKIVYRTVVKKVESPEQKQMYLQLEKKYEDSKIENDRLVEQLSQYKNICAGLTDTVNSLITSLTLIEDDINLSEINRDENYRDSKRSDVLALVYPADNIEVEGLKKNKRRFKIKLLGASNSSKSLESGLTAISF